MQRNCYYLPKKYLLECFEKLWPASLQCSWDNTGLLIHADHESPFASRPIYKSNFPYGPSEIVNEDDLITFNTLLTIDLTKRVVQEAIRNGVTMIVAYHPPIFNNLGKSFISGTPTNDIITQCIQHNISVFSPHTRLDNLPNDCINLHLLKSVVDNLDSGSAIFYLNDQFHSDMPTITVVDKKDSTEKIIGGNTKIELLRNLSKTVSARRHSDSATELLINIKNIEKGTNDNSGGPLIFFSKRPLKFDNILQKFKALLGIEHCQAASRIHDQLLAETSVNSIAVCVGSGYGAFKEILNCNLDLYITGEVAHHNLLRMLDQSDNNPIVLMPGHCTTERFYLKKVKEDIISYFKENFGFRDSNFRSSFEFITEDLIISESDESAIKIL
ncbi:MAG: hypothetical protein MHMPM18_004154 [Marteilia pararefringens]